jgi:hypothetical protein
MSTQSGGLIADNVMNNLFDNVSGDDATTGVTHYRCFYIKNTDPSITFTGVKIWISIPTLSASDEFDIGLDPAVVGTDTAKTSNGTSDPGGITWTPRPLSEGTAFTFDHDMLPGEQKAIWIKRTVQAGASAHDTNYGEISVSGETT